MQTLRVLFLFLALGVEAHAQAPVLYKALTAVHIGGDGGWDILNVDPDAHRVYLSHATKVIVVDTEKNTAIGEITDTPGVHAFFPVPRLGRGFSSNGRENKVSVVDLKTLKATEKIDVGENPDAVSYDEKRGEVYVFNHTGKSATVIDARSLKVVATIALEGQPEFGAVDPEAGRVYVNLEDKSEVAVIDTTNHKVIFHWPLAPGEEPSGIALDRAHHRLFSTCSNKMMMMLDTESGKLVGQVPIPGRVDGCAFDEKTQLVFASSGEGTTTIAKEESPDKLVVAQTLTTLVGARTIGLDPVTHRIYLPTAKFEPPIAPSPGASPTRPKIIPDTMMLLVYEPAKSR